MLASQKERQPNIILNDGRINILHKKKKKKKRILNLIESLDLNHSLEEIHKVEEYVKLHNNKPVNKVTTLGNSTSQTTQFFPQINYKGQRG